MMHVDIAYRCEKCKAHNKINVELGEPDWDFDEFYEDVQDPSSITTEEEWPSECIECEHEHYVFLEYNSFGADIEVAELPESDYSISQVHFDSGLDWLSALGLSSKLWKEEVFKNYLVSAADIKAITEKQSTDNGYSLINRMLFTQIISSFEAYLGDTLVQKVIGNKDAVKALIVKNTDLSSNKYSLHQIIEQPNIVEESVIKYLNEVIYHNIAKVEMLYKIALDIDFPINKDDRPTLYKAVKFRHDCVHRNGFDGKGKRLEIFTKIYLNKIQKLTETIARKLQEIVDRKIVTDTESIDE